MSASPRDDCRRSRETALASESESDEGRCRSAKRACVDTKDGNGIRQEPPRGGEKEEGEGGERKDELAAAVPQADSDAVALFCYMIVNFRPCEKINTHIGFSSNPPAAIDLHNRAELKATKSGAPDWIMQMIVGPMAGRLQARRAVSRWRHGKRGIISRIERGLRLAREERIVCWDAACDVRSQGS